MTLANGILDADALGDLYPRGLSGRKVLFITDSIGNASNASNVIYAYPWQSCLVAGTLLFPTALMAVAGYPGKRSDEIVANLIADLHTYDPDVVVFQFGTNNASQATPIATYIENITYAAKVCRDRSLPFIVVNVPPRSSSATAARQLATQAMNAWSALSVPGLGGVIADVWSPLSTSTDGSLQSGYVSGSDEVHPNDGGHGAMAQVVGAALKTAATPKAFLRGNSQANLCLNPLITGTIGASPANWFNAASSGDAATVGIVAATANGPYYGQLLEIDMNATTQNSSRTQGTTLDASKMDAGDWIMATWYQEQEFTSGIQINSYLTPVQGYGARLRVFNGSSGQSIVSMTRTCGLSGYQCAIFQVPNPEVAIGLYFDVAAASGTRIKGRIGQVCAVNLTQMGLHTIITG